MSHFLDNALALALDSAPWLLFGLLAAGLIRVWLPMGRVGQSLAGRGIGSVLKAALIGAPLPLCSCSTLPAAVSLRRAGASKASTTTFLIATPETGVDSVILSWVLLGPVMALVRPIAAIVSAIIAGLLVGRTELREPSVEAVTVEERGAASLGCAEGCEGVLVGSPPWVPPPGGIGSRLREGLRYAFTDLLDDLALWLLLGLLVAALVMTLVPPNLLQEWGSGPVAMLLIMLVSVPMYVCATASTPLAHAMLFAGVSPGTALVFLLAGPASNIAGLILVRRELGNKALGVYLFGVGGITILLGLLLDAVIAGLGLDLRAELAQVGSVTYELPVAFSMLSLLILLFLSIRPVRRYLLRGKAREDGSCCG